MVSKSELDSGVSSILSQPWQRRDGQVVPETVDVVQAGGAVELDASILYADLADSTLLASSFDWRTAAKVMKAFLYCSSRLITSNGGEIRSFDGDRVMGIFIGKGKNTSAAKTALQINWAVQNIVSPKCVAQFSSLRTQGFDIRRAVGIDTSTTVAVRAGMRGANDLIWIGRAAGVAAKLSSIREASYRSYITSDVYTMLAEEAKYAKGVDMWQRMTAQRYGLAVYRSNYTWALS